MQFYDFKEFLRLSSVLNYNLSAASFLRDNFSNPFRQQLFRLPAENRTSPVSGFKWRQTSVPAVQKRRYFVAHPADGRYRRQPISSGPLQGLVGCQSFGGPADPDPPAGVPSPRSGDPLRPLLMEAMEYCYNGLTDLVTESNTHWILDGLFSTYFGHTSGLLRDQQLDRLYQNKPMMIEALRFGFIASCRLPAPTATDRHCAITPV